MSNIKIYTHIIFLIIYLEYYFEFLNFNILFSTISVQINHSLVEYLTLLNIQTYINCLSQSVSFTEMKLFRMFQANLVMLGINSNKSTTNNKHQFNRNIFVSFFLSSSSIILTSVFIFCEADTFMDFAEPIYILSSAVMITITAVYTCIKIKMVFEFIKRFENIVHSSKLNY